MLHWMLHHFLYLWYGFGLLAAPFSYAITLAYFQGRFPTVRNARHDHRFSLFQAAVTVLCPPAIFMDIVMSKWCRYGLKFRAEDAISDDAPEDGAIIRYTRSYKFLIPLLAILAITAVPAHANTPGQHSVTLTWTASTTTGVTYNIYRGSSAGVCTGTVTPYSQGNTGTIFLDTVGLVDGQTIFYNVSAVKGGAESACNGEVQVQIPVLPSPPSGLSATAK